MKLNDGSHNERETIELKDEKPVSLCRCWKSKRFPYCDGAHRKHNEETGDHVGPVVIKKG